MSRRAIDTRPVDARRPLRVGALALATLMLVTACATGAPVDMASRYRPPVSHNSPEAGALESEADAGEQGEAFFTKLPTNFAPVQVSNAEFSAAMTTLWLDMPLRVAASRPPLYVGMHSRRCSRIRAWMFGFMRRFFYSVSDQSKPSPF